MLFSRSEGCGFKPNLCHNGLFVTVYPELLHIHNCRTKGSLSVDFSKGLRKHSEVFTVINNCQAPFGFLNSAIFSPPPKKKKFTAESLRLAELESVGIFKISQTVLKILAKQYFIFLTVEPW